MTAAMKLKDAYSLEGKLWPFSFRTDWFDVLAVQGWESHCQPIRESPYFGLIIRLLNLLLFWFLFHCWLVWSLGQEDSPGEGNGRGPWQAKVQGIERVRHNSKTKTFTFHHSYFSVVWESHCQPIRESPYFGTHY